MATVRVDILAMLSFSSFRNADGLRLAFRYGIKPPIFSCPKQQRDRHNKDPNQIE